MKSTKFLVYWTIVCLAIVLLCAVKIVVDSCNWDEANNAKIQRQSSCEYKKWLKP